MYAYYNTVRAKKFPESTWTREAIVENIAEAGTFERGLEKLKAYENESDLDTDLESKQKRKTKKARNLDNLAGRSTGEPPRKVFKCSLNVKKTTPILPKPPLRLTTKDNAHEKESILKSSTQSRPTSINSPKKNNIPNLSSEKNQSAVSTSKFTSATLQHNDYSLNTQFKNVYGLSKRIGSDTNNNSPKSTITSPVSAVKLNEVHSKDVNKSSWSDEHMFRRNISKYLNDIKLMLNIQDEKINEILEKQAENNILQARFLECQPESTQKHVKKDRTNQFRSQLPVKSLDVLQNIEDSLTLADFRNDMVSLFSGFGGRHVKETTYTIMKMAFTNSIGSLFNWSGQKEKLNFSGLQLTSVILETVRQVCKVKEIEVIDAIKDWLRHAPARQLRELNKNNSAVDGEQELAHESEDGLSIHSNETEDDNNDYYTQDEMDISQGTNPDQNSLTERKSDTTFDDTEV
ncbi:uncharacterized protein LOC122505411 [Leptopilina heterotoma]|uniref:uncharacterized protein LOC122505411 n=1 Tax=Leptopilina heterotoma TaxID=63436 RepID=UPI001CA922AC|nr:uncharacterized protein LOC122505411 [Leptopilina heterotoma]